MHELKIYRGVMCNETEGWWKIWTGTELSFQNWHKEYDEFWFEHLKVSKISTLVDWFWPKYIMFESWKYRGVIFNGTKDQCKIWRKTDLCFQKWHEEFGKFSQIEKYGECSPVHWLRQTRRNLTIEYLNLDFVTTPKLTPLDSFYAEKVFLAFGLFLLCGCLTRPSLFDTDILQHKFLFWKFSIRLVTADIFN